MEKDRRPVINTAGSMGRTLWKRRRRLHKVARRASELDMSFWSPCKKRIRRLMGTEVVKLTNDKFMDKLATEVKKEYEDEQVKKEEELALSEIRRGKELILKGILEAPYQPRKRHPVTKHVMDHGGHRRKRSRHSKSSKSLRKLKSKVCFEKMEDDPKTPGLEATAGQDGPETHDHEASQSRHKTFSTSTFGDVFQRLSSTLTTTSRKSEDGGKRSRLVKNTSKASDTRGTGIGDACQKTAVIFTSRRKLRPKKKRKRSKTSRRLLRIRTVQPNDEVENSGLPLTHQENFAEDDEDTLISQLQTDLLI